MVENGSASPSGKGLSDCVSPGISRGGAFPSEGLGSELANRTFPLLAQMWTQLQQKEPPNQPLVLVNDLP